jgi:hypothetical protein
MKTVRVDNDIVVEIMASVAGFALEDCFHPSILAMCQTVEDDVQLGWVRQEDGTFAAPVVEE